MHKPILSLVSFVIFFAVHMNVSAWDFNLVEEDCCMMCAASEKNSDGEEILLLQPTEYLETFSPIIVLSKRYTSFGDTFPVKLYVDGTLVSTLTGSPDDYFGGTSVDVGTKEFDAIAKGNELKIVIANQESIAFSLKGSSSAIKKLIGCVGKKF